VIWENKNIGLRKTMSDSEKQASDSEKPVTEPAGIEEVKKQMEEEKEEKEEKPQEPVKAKRKTMSTEEKLSNKKVANKKYYIRTRQKIGQVEQQAPKVQEPPKAPKAPKAPKVQEPVYEPSSPKTRMTEAYRELRLQEQERRSARYASWFQ
jgi:hypothetical protein